MSYTQIISINPEIRFGKPCIKGTRIAVVDVLGWLASGMTYEQISNDFPGITKEHILACLEYAADREGKLKIAL
jgi:uncharacterized protein (DUF433 family)